MALTGILFMLDQGSTRCEDVPLGNCLADFKANLVCRKVSITGLAKQVGKYRNIYGPDRARSRAKNAVMDI